MVVWNVPKERNGEVGEFGADIDEVSHCYERPTFDDWPYSLYTMIHGKEPSDCDRRCCMARTKWISPWSLAVTPQSLLIPASQVLSSDS